MTDVPPSANNSRQHGGATEDPDDEDSDLTIMTERACEKCGDLVLILSSRDWCDGCEMEDPA